MLSKNKLGFKKNKRPSAVLVNIQQFLDRDLIRANKFINRKIDNALQKLL